MEKKLCQPIMIGQMRLKNRMVMPPMVVRYASDDGYVTDCSRRYYEARAKGGVALVILEASYIHPAGQLLPNEHGISDDKFIPGLSQLVEAIHRHDAKAAVQLVHAGRVVNPQTTGVQPVAPSAIPAPGGETPRELTPGEITEIINLFVQAALRAKRAGFDGVEIHGAHGYLIDQFISPASNHRQDAYGGSTENRARLLINVIKAVKEAVGPNYPVWCRINGQEYGVDGGETLDQAKEVACLAEASGAVAIHVTATGPASPVNPTSAVFTPAPIAHLAAGIKQVVRVPVIAVGKMTAAAGEEILATGKADLIAFGRALFADPELPNKISSGKIEDIRPCILCMLCRDDLRYNPVVGLRCSVNATMGKEGVQQITPAEKPKKVLVVGGGPAGMEAARVAALRGHQVSLWEKETKLGGQLIAAAVAPHKDRIQALTAYLSIQLKNLGVSVELGREATAASIARLAPDATVIASGSSKLTPEIPGLAKVRTAAATAVLEGKAKVGKRVVIIGAELVACEVAEFLAQQKRRVTMVRRGPEVALKIGPSVRAPLLKRLKDQGVTMLTGVTYHEATEQGLTITTKEGQRKTLEADTIVLAAGAVPNQGLYQEIKNKITATYAIGDCVAPRNIHEAISEGYHTALTI